MYIHLPIGSQAILGTDNVTIDTKKAKEIIHKILRKHYDSLRDLLYSDLLQKVTHRMYTSGLVSVSVNNSPNFNNLLKEYNVMLRVCRDHSEYITYCQTFIRILSDQGGPLKKISVAIADDWDREIKEKLHISLKFTY